MYINNPNDPILPAFNHDREQMPSKIAELADANSRYTFFEAIREVADPMEMRQNSAKELSSDDYLLKAPEQDSFLLTRHRLSLLKSKIDQEAQRRDQENTQALKKAKFVSGLLGA
ncbi:MAG: hypothetical protein JSR17_00025 [Proteobacteria bacterium]|nr:hypothetical protein [Pseudomonadota bacterium]